MQLASLKSPLAKANSMPTLTVVRHVTAPAYTANPSYDATEDKRPLFH